MIWYLLCKILWYVIMFLFFFVIKVESDFVFCGIGSCLIVIVKMGCVWLGLCINYLIIICFGWEILCLFLILFILRNI